MADEQMKHALILESVEEDSRAAKRARTDDAAVPMSEVHLQNAILSVGLPPSSLAAGLQDAAPAAPPMSLGGGLAGPMSHAGHPSATVMPVDASAAAVVAGASPAASLQQFSAPHHPIAVPHGQMMVLPATSQMPQVPMAAPPAAAAPAPPQTCIEEGCDNAAEPNGSTGRCSVHGGGKQCLFEGCVRYAMSKGLCVLHGGGRICYHEGCGKLAHSQKTGLCLEHGNGKRCSFEGCNKYTVSKGLCIAHGGGKRCTVEGCNKSARGSTGMCISHGGGRRCSVQGCEKHIQTKGLCAEHGGGRPCQFAGGCNKFAENKGLCKAHGGGRRCNFPGCTKHTVSKGLCIAHGGGKRCQEMVNGQPCPKSAVGGSGKCKAHGGGRRCKEEGCNKHAVSRGLCVSHGGGRTRCAMENCDKAVCQNPGAMFPANCIDHQGLPSAMALIYNPIPTVPQGTLNPSVPVQMTPAPANSNVNTIVSTLIPNS